MKSVLYMVQEAYSRFLNLLFPEDCIGCAKRGHALCASCIQNLKGCEYPDTADIFALYDYRDPVIKKAIWNIKYHRRPDLGKTLGRLLYEGYMEEIANTRLFNPRQLIAVVPVPLSRRRHRERGYNQAEKIAKSFCASAADDMFELNKKIVVKKIDTLPQARITNRAKRLKNIDGAFMVVDPGKITGRIIIVIDDVTTTGATIREVMRVLKKSGAKKVYGVAFAH